MTKAPILGLQYFKKLFKINCDASRLGIQGVLKQDGRSIAFFFRSYLAKKGTTTCMIWSFMLLFRVLSIDNIT